MTKIDLLFDYCNNQIINLIQMSIIDIINTDVMMHVLDYLEDYNKMSFMMTCKEYYDFRNDVNYTNLYEYDSIKNLPFMNRFKRLVYRGKIPNIIQKNNQ
ncbi:putative F-box and FNIP repeat-containing protein [Megavirus chiliensis]|uniref:F-box and FNIP repeat-containing n=3 Tax=Megamimivirinae TaxID=3044648 RepID=A0A2L2DNL4_MIMIV|nr:putative F-box and FNIP repeat-containing protein [Megavirus chiliensis]AVG47753.1 F-box and FNIP repeat-containing [Acanthamoeba polyphaga mimivirus]